MLLTAPEYARWRRSSLWIFIFLVGTYIAYARRGFPHGGSFMGIVYGALGLAAILILMYFGVRKRSYKSSVGTVQGWLQAHIYLGLLVFFIILFHTGFRFHDQVAMTAFILFTVVVVSGIAGAVLYTFVPPMLIDVESNFTAQEISAQINQLAEAVTRFGMGSKSPSFQALCAALVRVEEPSSLAGWRIVFTRYRSQQLEKNRVLLLDQVNRLTQMGGDDFSQLLVLGNQMKELHDRLIQKQRYINVMAVWLYLHVPLSFAMMVAIVAHITAVFYYW